jgi:alkylhydroperoxidase family enzyme
VTLMREIETMRLDVERRMRRGERFSDVEDVVNASDLSDDEKAALWLLAWSFLHPRAQRRQAIAHLERLSAATPPPPVDRRRHLRAIG